MQHFMINLAKANLAKASLTKLDIAQWDILYPIRHWLDLAEIHNPQLAHLICKLIPASCPFAREIKLRNQTILNIPPLCKLNPLYEQFVMLRFKSLVCLADEYGQDITLYC